MFPQMALYSNKYGPNKLLSELWQLLNFNTDPKIKIIKKTKKL